MLETCLILGSIVLFAILDYYVKGREGVYR